MAATRNSLQAIVLALAFSIVAGGLFAVTPAAWAADEAPTPPDHEWSFDGPFGTFDQPQLQRGFQVYQQVCSTCHSLKYVAYRHLSALGYNEDEIKAIAAQKQIEDGPDDNGDMFMRPAVPSDYFVPPFANEQQARAANGGALPPDLSLITKARHGGPDYVRALLVGYEDAPEDVELAAGMNYNEYFPGQQIAMFQPLFAGQVSYADGTEASVDQMAEDVVAFLVWAAEKELPDRKRIGFKVILFLIVLSALLYATKRRVWAQLH